MVDTTEITVDGYRYVLRHAPARVSLRAGARLLNVAGPLVDGLARGQGAVGRTLGGIAEAIADPLLGDHIVALCDAFAPYTEVHTPDGKSFSLGSDGRFDSHFGGRVLAVAAWLEAAIEWELGDFLGEIKKRLDAAQAKREADKSSSPSPTDAGTTG